MRTLFLEAFKPHVSDINQYCLHLLASGGASDAANRGIPDMMFKRHGRWLSESAEDGIIEDSVEERLKVSRSLGLKSSYQMEIALISRKLSPFF